MQQYAVYILFYCNIVLHVSGAVNTHHQEYIQLQPLVQIICSCSYLTPTWSRWSEVATRTYDLYQWL